MAFKFPFSTFILKQDPNKPSAHIEGAAKGTGVTYQANTGIFYYSCYFFDGM